MVSRLESEDRKLNTFDELSLYAHRKFASCLSRRRNLKILFSGKDDWEPHIRRSFRFSGHALTFGSITAETVADNDLVVPLTIEDIVSLNGIRPLIADNPIPIPSLESVRLCDDKYLFNVTLAENRYGDLIPGMGDGLRYPYILKKKIDLWGANSHIVSGRDQERSLHELLSSPEYYRQELVYGKKEYATHILRAKDGIVHSINIEYIFDKEIYIKGKDTALSQGRTGVCPFLDLFSSVLEFVGFEGLCCINYKVSSDGRPLLIEINPRFGGSLSGHFHSFLEFLLEAHPERFVPKAARIPGKGNNNLPPLHGSFR